MRDKVRSDVRKTLETVLDVRLPEDDKQVSRKYLSAWDSIKHVQVIFAIEDVFGLEVKEESIIGLNDLDSICDYIEEVANAN